MRLVCNACNEEFKPLLMVDGEPCPKLVCLGVLEKEEDDE